MSKQVSNLKNAIKSNPIVNVLNPFKWKNAFSDGMKKVAKFPFEVSRFKSLNPNNIISKDNVDERYLKINDDDKEKIQNNEFLIQGIVPIDKKLISMISFLDIESKDKNENAMKKKIIDGKKDYSNVILIPGIVPGSKELNFLKDSFLEIESENKNENETKNTKVYNETDHINGFLIHGNAPSMKELNSTKSLFLEIESEDKTENKMNKKIIESKKDHSNMLLTQRFLPGVKELNSMKSSSLEIESENKNENKMIKNNVYTEKYHSNEFATHENIPSEKELNSMKSSFLETESKVKNENKIKQNFVNIGKDHGSEFLFKGIAPGVEQLNSRKSSFLEIESKDKSENKMRKNILNNSIVISHNRNNNALERFEDSKESTFKNTATSSLKITDVIPAEKSNKGTLGLILEKMKTISNLIPNPFPENVYLNAHINLAATDVNPLNMLDNVTPSLKTDKNAEKGETTKIESQQQYGKPFATSLRYESAHAPSIYTTTLEETQNDGAISDLKNSDIVKRERHNFSESNSFKANVNLSNQDHRSNDSNNLMFRMNHSDSNDLHRKILIDFYEDLYLPSRMKLSKDIDENKITTNKNSISRRNHQQEMFYELEESNESSETEKDVDIKEFPMKYDKNNYFGENERATVRVKPIKKDMIDGAITQTSSVIQKQSQQEKTYESEGTNKLEDYDESNEFSELEEYDRSTEIQKNTYIKEPSRKYNKNYFGGSEGVSVRIKPTRKVIAGAITQKSSVIPRQNYQQEKSELPSKVEEYDESSKFSESEESVGSAEIQKNTYIKEPSRNYNKNYFGGSEGISVRIKPIKKEVIYGAITQKSSVIPLQNYQQEKYHESEVSSKLEEYDESSKFSESEESDGSAEIENNIYIKDSLQKYYKNYFGENKGVVVEVKPIGKEMIDEEITRNSSVIPRRNDHQEKAYNLDESKEYGDSVEVEKAGRDIKLPKKHDEKSYFGVNEGVVRVKPINDEIIDGGKNEQVKLKLIRNKELDESTEEVEYAYHIEKLPKIIGSSKEIINKLNVTKQTENQIVKPDKRIDGLTLRNNTALLKREDQLTKNNFDLTGETDDEKVDGSEYMLVKPLVIIKTEKFKFDNRKNSKIMTNEANTIPDTAIRHKSSEESNNTNLVSMNSSKFNSENNESKFSAKQFVNLEEKINTVDHGKILSTSNNVDSSIAQEKSFKLNDMKISEVLTIPNKSLNTDIKYENSNESILSPAILKEVYGDNKMKVTPPFKEINSPIIPEQKYVNAFTDSPVPSAGNVSKFHTEHIQNKSVIKNEIKPPNLKENFIEITVVLKSNDDSSSVPENQSHDQSDKIERNNVVVLKSNDDARSELENQSYQHSDKTERNTVAVLKSNDDTRSMLENQFHQHSDKIERNTVPILKSNEDSRSELENLPHQHSDKTKRNNVVVLKSDVTRSALENQSHHISDKTEINNVVVLKSNDDTRSVLDKQLHHYSDKTERNDVVFKSNDDTHSMLENQSHQHSDKTERNKIVLFHDVNSKPSIPEAKKHTTIKNINVFSPEKYEFKIRNQSTVDNLKSRSQLSEGQSIPYTTNAPVIHSIPQALEKLDVMLRQIIRFAFLILTSKEKDQPALDINEDLEQLLRVLKIKAAPFMQDLFQTLRIQDGTKTLIMEGKKCGLPSLEAAKFLLFKNDIKMLGHHLNLGMEYYSSLKQLYQEEFLDEFVQKEPVKFSIDPETVFRSNFTEGGKEENVKKKGRKNFFSKLWENVKSFYSTT